MKLKWIAALGVLLLTSQAGAEETPVLKSRKDMESYAVGVEVVRNFKRQGFDIDLDVVIKGMKDAFAGDKLLLSDRQLLEILNMFASELRQKKIGDKLTAGLDNKKKGEEFLAANQTKEGVVTLPSGLQYKIIKDGKGKKPTAEDTVEVNYRGTLINGTLFESTYDAGQPATINIAEPRVIAGLREALKLMPVGSQWQLFIPSQLAYGQRPSGRVIGPYETLIFEIEVLAIKDRPEAAQAQQEKKGN